MNSLDIAKEYEKEHSKVMRSIKVMLKKNPELSSHYHNSYFYDSYKRKQPAIEFDDIGEQILRDKFKFNVRGARFEYKMLNEICDCLDELKIQYIKQYPVLTYRIDLFLPYYNLSIEYDEDAHKFNQKYDKYRENNIKESIGCEFIRIKEDECVGTAIGRILKKIGGDTLNGRKII